MSLVNILSITSFLWLNIAVGAQRDAPIHLWQNYTQVFPEHLETTMKSPLTLKEINKISSMEVGTSSSVYIGCSNYLLGEAFGNDYLIISLC